MNTEDIRWKQQFDSFRSAKAVVALETEIRENYLSIFDELETEFSKR